MCEIENEQTEVTMSSNTKKHQQPRADTSSAFHKMEKLGPSSGGQIPNKPNDVVSDTKEKSAKPFKKFVLILTGLAVFVATILLVILILPCKHEWDDATCSQAKTCTKCEKTDGDPLGHSWSKATCTKPAECKRCKETEGKALGHKWKEKEEIDYVKSKIVKFSVCNTCNVKEERETVNLTTLLDSNKSKFKISAADFMGRLNSILKNRKKNNGITLDTVWTNETAYLRIPGIDIKDTTGDIVASIVFLNSARTDPALNSTEKNKELSFDAMLLEMYNNNDIYWNVVPAFSMACDPVYDDSEQEAEDFGNRLLRATQQGNAAMRGDIIYNLEIQGNYVFLEIMPVELAY